MPPIRSVQALNTFVALEGPSVAHFVAGLRRDRRTDLTFRMRNHVVQTTYDVVRDTHRMTGQALAQGFGTGRAPFAGQHDGRHVRNPGLEPGVDTTQAALQGGIYAPLVALVCWPWLHMLGVGILIPAAITSAAAAATAVVVHHLRSQGHSAPWLEEGAGLLTALGRASLTVYAALIGAAWGVVTARGALAPHVRSASRP